jgi:ribonuclease E
MMAAKEEPSGCVAVTPKSAAMAGARISCVSARTARRSRLMAKRMLIDATHPEETRVVVLAGNRLEDFDFETSTKKQLKGNIYLAKVTRVEPSLQAAFVDYGGNRHGFLAFSEIHPDYYQIPVADRERLLAEMAKIERGESTGGNGRDERRRDDRRGRKGRRDDRRGRKGRRGTEEEAAEGAAAIESTADSQVPIETSAEPAPSEGTPEAATASIADAQPDEPTRAATEPGPAAAANAGETASELPATDPAETRSAAGGDNPPALAESAGTGQPVLYDAEGSYEPAEVPPLEGMPEPAGAEPNGEAAGEATGEAGNEAAGESQVEVIGGDDNEELARRRQRLLRNYKIQEVIKRRQILLVQVVKEERGTKGAALTTYLSLAGRYCVLMPNTARGGGVSRKITNASDRKRLKSMIDELELPEGMGLIVRTAGSERTKNEIKRDCDYLLRLWDSIRETTLSSTAPCLIHAEADLIKRSIRDLYARDIEEVLVEGEEQYKAAKDFMKMLMPSHAKRVQRYKDGGVALFQRFQVEAQLDAMHSPVVPLKSGGSIVINQTEALVAIDVNSGRATRERHIEETALKTNLEAADEVARQLRLRDLAGLIVIDFIDMEDNRHNHQVERRLKEAMRHDRARIQIGRISPFGLLELSRQRLRPSLVEASTTLCPHCGGTGHIRSTESTSLHVLRSIEEEAGKRRAAELTVYVPTEVALYILNHKRTTLAEIEARNEIKVFLAHDDTLVPPNHRIERTKARELTVAPEPRAAAALPPPPAAAANDDDEDEEQEAAATPRASETSGSEAAQPGEGGEERTGRRRRRRRRRRGGGDRPHHEGQTHERDAAPRPGEMQPLAAAPAAGGEAEAPGEEGDEPELPGSPVAGEAAMVEEGEGGRRRRRGRRRRGRREEQEGGGEEGYRPAEEPRPMAPPPAQPQPMPQPMAAPAAPPPSYRPAYQPHSVADQVLSAFEQLESQESSPRPAAPAEAIPAPPPVPIDPNPPVQVIGGDATVTPKRGGWWQRR